MATMDRVDYSQPNPYNRPSNGMGPGQPWNGNGPGYTVTQQVFNDTVYSISRNVDANSQLNHFLMSKIDRYPANAQRHISQEDQMVFNALSFLRIKADQFPARPLNSNRIAPSPEIWTPMDRAFGPT